MYNLLTQLARVRLSKHYATKTTMYRSLRIDQGERDLTNIYLDQLRK